MLSSANSCHTDSSQAKHISLLCSKAGNVSCPERKSHHRSWTTTTKTNLRHIECGVFHLASINWILPALIFKKPESRRSCHTWVGFLCYCLYQNYIQYKYLVLNRYCQNYWKNIFNINNEYTYYTFIILIEAVMAMMAW